jgi:hypothetical protein
MVGAIVRTGWKIIVGVGIVAALIASFDQSQTLQEVLPKLWPWLAATLRAVSGYMNGLAVRGESHARHQAAANAE